MKWFLSTMVFIIYAVITKTHCSISWRWVISLYAQRLMSLILIRFPNLVSNGIWRDSLFLYEIGVTIELIFFLIALAFKKPRRF